MLRRKVYDELVKWKGKSHNCLLVKGQRQVGKTFIIEQFAHDNYDHFVEVNLSEMVDARDAFNGNLSVDEITRKLSLFVPGARFVPGSTLLFLDEIQDCPRARTSLKFFSIDGRFDVIASGSLLGVDINRPGDRSDDAPIPVGYEEHLEMHSLDFEEYIWARGVSEQSIDHVRHCLRERIPLGDAYLNRFRSLFRDYMVTGGMPKVVQTFIDTNNYREAWAVIDSILDAAKADMSRYTRPTEGVKVIHCFTSIPSQLGSDNKKFMFSRVEGDGQYRSAEKYYSSLDWIRNAGYGNFCYRLGAISRPLAMNMDRNHFKVYFSDTGMLLHMYGEQTTIDIYNDNVACNKGAIAENVVAECLMKCGIEPRYYIKNGGTGRMELDFVIELGMDVAVIEVKSGKNRTSPSLDKVAGDPNVDRRIMFEMSDIYVDDSGVEHYPLFAVAFIDSIKGPVDYPR